MTKGFLDNEFEEEGDDLFVQDLFELDEEKLKEFASASEYWGTVLDFYTKVKKRPIASLSEKQKNWLQKIQVDLTKEDHHYDNRSQGSYRRR